MKKTVIPIVLIAVLLVGFIVSVPLVNNHSAKEVERRLVSTALPDNTEIVESLSKAGKLVGNGNGMQYFGAMLIKSELGLEELEAYYSEIISGSAVREQKSRDIEIIEHGTLSFEAEISDTEGYFIVYLFGSGKKPFSELDIRGH